MSINEENYVGHTPFYLCLETMGNFHEISNELVSNMMYPEDLAKISELVSYFKERKAVVHDGSAYPLIPEVEVRLTGSTYQNYILFIVIYL